MKFELRATATGSRARRGTIETLHATIETPVFMPVGTRGSVRTQTLGQLAELGPAIILANTYHLLVRPGLEAFTHVGGLHRWMKWPRAILTDSGGFQIFSLPNARSLGEDGAAFTSYADGRKLMLTPELSIAMQRAIGSDIMMALDQCIDSTSPHAHARAAMELTHRWAHRSLAARGESPQALFAIVQGACFPDLRRESARVLTGLPGFDGYAIGGLAVGETRAQREDLTELVAGLLPADKPRYLMGVGTPIDLLEAVHRGVDMFDCVLPTAWAQQGVVFTSHGKIDLRRGVHRLAEQALDAACPCEACVTYPRSYLHHLVKCKEPLGWQLLAFHNLRFYLRLMQDIRDSLDAGTFAALYAERRATLALVDQDNPPGRHPRGRTPKPNTRGAFVVHTSTRGFASIQHVASGEIMHPIDDPNIEADRLYVEQSALIAAALRDPTRPLCIWDVGLGAAHNAMAVIRRFAAAGAHGPVSLVSFERDLDAFHLALAHQKEFPHLRHAAPHRFAIDRAYRAGELAWTLHPGDFRDTFTAAPMPDVILFDPFSSAVDTAMWSLATFEALFAHLARPVELFTYSSSTAVRASLLAAGFHVARGIGSGAKAETTIALKPDGEALLAGHARLDRAWLERRARSSARFAADIPAERHAELERRIADHPQFALR